MSSVAVVPDTVARPRLSPAPIKPSLLMSLKNSTVVPASTAAVRVKLPDCLVMLSVLL